MIYGLLYGEGAIPGKYQMMGISTTFGALFINIITPAMLDGDSYTEGACGPGLKKFGFVLAIIALMGGWISSAVIMDEQYIQKANRTETPGGHGAGPGECLFVQSFLILISGLLYRFARGGESGY